MTKKTIYIWASDFSNFTGEGNLGRLFVSLKLKKKYSINICKFQSGHYIADRVFGHKYVLPILGIINCWKYFLLGKKVCYLNYLPLWNSLIFLLLPPKTILGPITGGSYFKKELNFNYLVRKFIFPLFYFFSSYILFFRKFDTIFSTTLLKKYLNKSLQKRSKFNFVLEALNLSGETKNKKNLQFLVYYKKHKNKLNLYPLDLIEKLVNQKLKVLIVGDTLEIPGVKNLGYLSRKNLKKILIKSKYAILSNENIFSFFAIECLNSNVKLVVTNKINEIDKNIKQRFVYLNPNKIKKLKIEDFLRDL